MNKKQCQKCGEENPPEAVMCWACYTPLTGAAAGTAAGQQAKQAAAREDSEKKPIQPWQMGVVGLALLVGIGMGIKTMLPSGDTVIDETQTTIDTGAAGRTGSPPPSQQAPQVTTQGKPSDVQLPAPPAIVPNQQPLMRVEVPPNPKMDVATIGIVPTESNVSEYRAASLAVLAHKHIVNARRWRKIQIYVFSDQQAAAMFRKYQKSRRGAPLEHSDYQSLGELWRRTPAVYEFAGPNERWISPLKYPNDWWTRWPNFSPRAM